ncbi:hypothetical protein [Photobacterium damselae]|uniref:hypothetical protein n=1 Tax=Photobacterium damselae TaxID=38293 RepID=UPI001F43997A|nr:hypothetical protein [Photobacterium damselae]UKA04478.1 hypothetical protein IHC89_22915 [Photobacterium damselae subsp. damselae]
MNDEVLAPMSDALSATLAVFILLISFFVMAQVQAVSRLIKMESAGINSYIHQKMVVTFDKPYEKNDKLIFFKSFDLEKDKDVVDDYIKNRVSELGLKKDDVLLIKSNYPMFNITADTSVRRASLNAIKLAKEIKNLGYAFSITLSNNLNYYYLEIDKG